MSLVITKSDGKFTAKWTDRTGLPDGEIATPLTQDELIKALRSAGHHLKDIYDELFRIDPEEILRQNPDARKLLGDAERSLSELKQSGIYPWSKPD